MGFSKLLVQWCCTFIHYPQGWRVFMRLKSKIQSHCASCEWGHRVTPNWFEMLCEKESKPQGPKAKEDRASLTLWPTGQADFFLLYSCCDFQFFLWSITAKSMNSLGSRILKKNSAYPSTLSAGPESGMLLWIHIPICTKYKILSEATWTINEK